MREGKDAIFMSALEGGDPAKDEVLNRKVK